MARKSSNSTPPREIAISPMCPRLHAITSRDLDLGSPPSRPCLRAVVNSDPFPATRSGSNPVGFRHHGAPCPARAASRASPDCSGTRSGGPEAVDPKRPRTAHYEAVILPSPEEKKLVPTPATAIKDSRRLFQRLWTEEDEIELLQGFLDYTNQRGGANRGGGGGSHQNDTALFYDQIKSKLQLEFNKNQLVEKLRRLKKKYRNLLNKLVADKEFTFKSPHDQATFEISKKICSNFDAAVVVVSTAANDNALDDNDLNPNNNHSFNLNHYEIKSEESPPGFLKSTSQRPRKRRRG